MGPCFIGGLYWCFGLLGQKSYRRYFRQAERIWILMRTESCAHAAYVACLCSILTVAQMGDQQLAVCHQLDLKPQLCYFSGYEPTDPVALTGGYWGLFWEALGAHFVNHCDPLHDQTAP